MQHMDKTDIYAHSINRDLGNWWSSISSPLLGFFLFRVILSFSFQHS